MSDFWKDYESEPTRAALMTTNRALDLALDALEKISRTHYHIETPPIESLEEKMRRIADKAITAIKQARALDKKAENARELGLDYEPVQKQRWAVFCSFCNKEWSVSYQHPGKSVCLDCDDAPPAQPAPNLHYSIDADPSGIRKRVAVAIIGALDLGAKDSYPPPKGHWLQRFWNIGRAEASKATPPAAQSCPTCEALARSVMMDQTGRDA